MTRPEIDARLDLLTGKSKSGTRRRVAKGKKKP